MNLLQQSALAWKEITEYRYSLIYGYKKQLYPLHLTFSLEDYPHLAGFQYMKDLSLPNYNSSKIVTRMYPFFTSIKADYILSSHYKLDNFIFIIKATAKDELKCDFKSLIEPRLKALIHIKESLDNEFTLLILYLS